MDVKGSIAAAWIAATLVSLVALAVLSAANGPPEPEGLWRDEATMEEGRFPHMPSHLGAPEYSLRYRGDPYP